MTNSNITETVIEQSKAPDTIESVGGKKTVSNYESAKSGSSEERPVFLKILLNLLLALLLLALIAMIVLGYVYSWHSVGVVEYEYDPNGIPKGVKGIKTIWDWLDLLIVPLILGLGAFGLNKSARENERKIAEDRQNQTTLEAYFDRMVELLVEYNLLSEESEKKDMLSLIARTRTLAVLRSLDGKRKGQVVQFLHEAGLIYFKRTQEAKPAVIRLQGADLVGANLSEAPLPRVDLYRVNLSGANLSKASLIGANLSRADLRGANLNGSRLMIANLSRAKVTDEQLDKAESLKGAIMPDGTKHD